MALAEVSVLMRKLRANITACFQFGAAAFALALMASTAPAAAQTAAEVSCGGLANAFGPFDYRSDHFKLPPGDQYPYAYKLNLVEIAHFTPEVEALLRGKSTHLPGPDIDYTLRAFPNHHRALITLSRLAERTKIPAPAGLPRPIECYFDRAVRFVPDDSIVRLIFANYLIRRARLPEARGHIEAALRVAGDNPFTHYNIGLSFFEAGDHAAALTQAHRAMALGFPRADLKQKLVAVGRWTDPVADVAAAAASSPAAAASAGAPR